MTKPTTTAASVPVSSTLTTAEQLKQRASGLTVDQQIAAIDQAFTDHQDAAQRIADHAEREGRDWLASERREWDKLTDEQRRLTVLRQTVDANRVDYRQVLDNGGGDLNPGGLQRGYHLSGDHTYRPDDTRSSWLRDLVAAGVHGSSEARERLYRNNTEVAREHRAMTAGADGFGGEFVPPYWAMQQLVALSRAGRVIADQVSHDALPPGTDSISVPRLVGGTEVAEQANELDVIQETTATTDAITAKVHTLAGKQTLSLQLVEQSPIPVDRLVLGDLLADLANKTDRFLISSNVLGAYGMLNVAGLNAVTYTDTTPTPSELYPKVADAIQRIHTSRYLPPSKIFMHPRGWGWFLGAVDAGGRPFVAPLAQLPGNTLATHGGVISEGLVGSMQGLPVYVDANLPTNLGTGSNEDRIVIARAEDVTLYESVPRAEAFREPLADRLGILVRVYNYVATHGGRTPKSIAVISGTGLVAPTF